MSETKAPSPLARMFSLVKTGPKALFLRFYEQGTRIRKGYPVWKLSKITDQLYVGGQHRKHGWKAMEEEGITAIVNMREAWHDDVKDNIGGAEHLHLVTRDNTPPTLEDLQKGVAFMDKAIENGGKVFVHCGLGVGRAPTMLAAYLIYKGEEVDEALEKIRKVRPFIHLTPRQKAQLNAYQDLIKETKTDG
ncbi:hypothetical protein MASR2M15_07340 [Anaerolineales bacterium]